MKIFNYLIRPVREVGLVVVLFVFAFLIISNKTILFGTNADTSFSFLGQYAPVVLLPTISFLYKKYRHSDISTSDLNFIILITIVVFASGFVNNNIRPGYVFMILTIFAGILSARTFSLDNFMKAYVYVVTLIAGYSIIVYLFFLIDPSLIITNFPIIVNIRDYIFANVYLCCIPLNMNSETLRLFGPFSEPGIFQIYINFAILFHLLLNRRPSNVVLIILSMALVLTFSTTGYIAFFFCILLYIRQTGSNGMSVKGLVAIFFIVIALFLLYTKTDILSSKGMVFDKLDDTTRTTTAARLGSIWGNLNIFFSNPLFGIGITNMPFEFQRFCIAEYGVDTQSNTNSILIPFAMFGITYGFLFVSSLIKFCKCITESNSQLILILTCVFVSLIGENITENIFLYILIGYGIQKTHLSKKSYEI